MSRASDITAWLAAAVLVCAITPGSSAENHRRMPEPQNRPSNQSRPNNQGRPSNPSPPNNANRSDGQAVPRPQQNQAPTQGHHAGQWLRRYQGVPFDQQKKALETDPNFRKLAPERQERLQQRLQLQPIHASGARIAGRRYEIASRACGERAAASGIAFPFLSTRIQKFASMHGQSCSFIDRSDKFAQRRGKKRYVRGAVRSSRFLLVATRLV